MKIITKAAIAAMLSAGLCVAPAEAGISLGQTRIVYPQASVSQTVSLQNSGNDVYLVQGAVTDWESDKPSAQFSVLPPLFRLEGHSTNTLRVMRTGGTLPEDRESIFHFRVNAIPAGAAPKADAGASVSVALGMGIKLFYRPDGLPMTPEQAYGRVTFRRQNGEVEVSNPTPYYLTFATLSLGGETMDLQRLPMMLAPFSQRIYPLSGKGNQAEWSFITDYGSTSERQHATLQ